MVIQQNSRKLLMMDVLLSEKCWAYKKWNKIASDIKVVFYSSTITIMHGPINIRYTGGSFFRSAVTNGRRSWLTPSGVAGLRFKVSLRPRLTASSWCAETEIYLYLYCYTFQPLDTILRQMTTAYTLSSQFFSKQALRGIFSLKRTLNHITHAVWTAHHKLLVLITIIPYILESNPHTFYSFRGLKKSDAD